ncbi:MAG: AraC family transcriptional regulator [Polyangiaceae bacterium]|nr:AraC family transcriptional regulator [Polyangiaceae bacterium]
MTDDATNSTSDANADGIGILAALVRGNLEAAGAFGFDADALARSAGLSPESLADPDGRVPFERYVALWEAIESDARSQRFALWLAQGIQIGALGVVGYVMQHAADARAALDCMERHSRLLGEGVAPTLTDLGDRISLHRTEPPRIARLTALSIAAPLGTVTLLRQLTRLPIEARLALEVAFQHPPPSEPIRSELETILGCPIIYNATETRLILSKPLLERPLAAPNPSLFEYLERHARSLSEKLKGASSTANRVRELLVARVREGEPDQSAIAKALALSERTLQRRLQEENATFAELVDEVRRDLARMYLADPKLAVFEIAFLLGYSEPSAFNRAFKRWTGSSPSAYRATIEGNSNRRNER